MVKKKSAEDNAGLLEDSGILKTILSSTMDNILYLDTEGTILFTNKQVSLGKRKRDEVLGRKFMDIVHLDKESSKKIPSLFKRILEEKKGIQGEELTYTDKDGSSITVEISAKPVKKKGKVVGSVIVIRDMTEKKEAQDELKENEKKYRELFNTALVGIIVHDSKGNITSVNDRAEKIFGIKEKELMKKDLDFWRGKLIRSDGKPMQLSDFPLSIVAKTKLPSENRVVGLSMKKGNGISWFMHSARPIQDKKGNIGKIITSFIDITDRKISEEKLHESKETIYALMNSMPDSASLIDKKGRILALNIATAEILGKDTEALIGKCIYNHLPSDVARHRKEKISEVINSGKPLNFEDVREGKIISSRIYPIHDSKKNVMQLAIFGRDITEKKKAERDLNHSYNIINKSPIAVFLWQNKEDWPVVYVSENVKGLFGYSAEDFRKGRIYYSKVIHPEDLKKVDEEVSANSRDKRKKEFTQEYRIKTKDGEVKWVDDHTFIIRDDEGKITNYQGIIIDITERKQAEEMLRESEKQYRQLFEGQVNAFAIFRSVFGKKGNFVSCRFIDINSAYERITGVKKEEVIGKDIQDVFPGTEDSWINAYGSVAVSGKPKTFEMYHDPTKKHYFCNVFRPWQTKERFCVAFNDTTERKKADEKLKESEEMFRTYYNSSKDAIMMLDKNGFFDCNPATLKLFNVGSVEEFKKLHPSDTSPKKQPDGTDSYKASMKKINEAYRKGINHFNWKHKQLHGKEFYADVLLTKMKLKGKNVLQATVRDISERKKAENQVKESEERLSMLMNAMQAGVLMIDAEKYEIEDANPMACKMIGLPKDKILGRKCHRFICTAEKGKCPITDMDETIDNSEKILLDSKGNKIPVLKTVVPIKFKGKKYLIDSFVDLRNQKQAEEELRESQEKLEAVLDNIGIGVSLISPDMKVLFLNRQMREWFPKIDLEKKPLCYKALNNPPLKDICQGCPTIKTLKDGKLHESVSPSSPGNKKLKYRVISSPIRDENGKILSAIEMVQDITEKERIQEEIKKRKEELEKFSRFAVGREERMLELKNEINRLCTELGKKQRYKSRK